MRTADSKNFDITVAERVSVPAKPTPEHSSKNSGHATDVHLRHQKRPSVDVARPEPPTGTSSGYGHQLPSKGR